MNIEPSTASYKCFLFNYVTQSTSVWPHRSGIRYCDPTGPRPIRLGPPNSRRGYKPPRRQPSDSSWAGCRVQLADPKLYLISRTLPVRRIPPSPWKAQKPPLVLGSQDYILHTPTINQNPVNRKPWDRCFGQGYLKLTKSGSTAQKVCTNRRGC